MWYKNNVSAKVRHLLESKKWPKLWCEIRPLFVIIPIDGMPLQTHSSCIALVPNSNFSYWKHFQFMKWNIFNDFTNDVNLRCVGLMFDLVSLKAWILSFLFTKNSWVWKDKNFWKIIEDLDLSWPLFFLKESNLAKSISKII